MKIKILLLVTILIIVNGCSENRSNDAEIIQVKENDKEMNAAMEKARETFPEFIKVIDKESIPAMIKAYFDDSGAFEDGEHMWVTNIRIDGKIINGVLSSSPITVKKVKMGDKVSFPLKRLSDWLYVKNGKAYGAYTVNLLRNRMTEYERIQHDNNYPFKF